MTDTLILTATDKRGRYAELLPQLEALAEESDAVARQANLAAALHQAFGWHWVGFYRVVGQQLVLGPFQGPVACTRIPFGRGVCGTAWRDKCTLVVDDVDAFPGHIACSSLSRAEIVVPVFNRDGQVAGVLDVDAVDAGHFDDIDREALELLSARLTGLHPYPL